MINLKEELENYSAIDIKNVLEISPDIPDNVKNSIILYNKALESLKQGSEDIAIIGLKKAVAMNPSFHEAMNLLGLCYNYTKEYSKAVEIFERVVAAENNSVQAMRYLNVLNPGSGQAGPAEGRNKGPGGNKAAGQGKKKPPLQDSLNKIKPNMTTSGIMKYVIGFTAGVLLVLIVVLAGNAIGKKDAAEANAEAGTLVSDTADSVDYKVKFDQLNDEFTALQSELDSANKAVEYYKNAAKLFEIDNLVSGKKLEEAADTLVLLRSVAFKDAEKEKFDSLMGSVMPKAAAVVLSDGIKLMNSRKYQDALNKFNKIKVYGSDMPNADRALYNAGKCYTYLDDSRNALAAFQELKEKYPKSGYAAYADNRIKSLTQKP